MSSPAPSSTGPNPWIGRILTALPAFALAASALMKLSGAPQGAAMNEHLGIRPGTPLVLGVLELLCVITYLVPRTAALGAILLTGYLGGAVFAHVRVGDPFVAPVVLGALVWAGLYFRDERVRALLPLRP